MSATPPAKVTVRPASDRDRSCSWDAITTVAPAGDGVTNQAVEKVPMFGIEAGVGLVQQPQFGVAGEQGGQRGPPALAGGQGADRRGGQPSRQAQPVEGGSCRLYGPARSAYRKAHIVCRGQIVIEGSRMPQQPDPPSYGARISHQICAQHHGLATDDAQQPGAGSQEAGLAGPVRALEQDDLAPRHVEVDACQNGEAPNQGNSGSKMNHGVHDGHRNGSETGAGSAIRGPPPGAGASDRRKAPQPEGAEQVGEPGGQHVQVVGQQQHPETGEQ